MVTFIIVRHGYSKGNKEKRFSGQMDVPLDDIGLFQAEETSKYILDNFKVDEVYASDLSRAYKTVEPIAKALCLNINKTSELREIDVGIWSGMLVEDIKKQYPRGYEMYVSNPGLFSFEGGESYSDGMLRSKLAFEKIAEKSDGKTVVVGVHGGNIRTLRAAWNNIPIEEIKDIPHVPNASVTVVEYEKGKVEWIKIGYTEHLKNKTTEDSIKLFK